MNRIRICALCVIAAFICGCAAPVSVEPFDSVVLIDPGHGGFDGGAVASDGTLEKDINLDVSLHLRDMLFICGITVEMTRDTDASTQSADATTIREKKVSDMHNRLVQYEQSSLVIAVHQNHFQQSKYSGTQVFYSGNHTESQHLAEAVQRAVATDLQPNNNRQIKRATDGVYLMHHTSVPAILVECGFLSNPEELAQLKDAQYRQKMAWVIQMGYWNYKTER